MGIEKKQEINGFIISCIFCMAIYGALYDLHIRSTRDETETAWKKQMLDYIKHHFFALRRLRVADESLKMITTTWVDQPGMEHVILIKTRMT